MKALLIHDHSLVRHGLEMLLTMQLGFSKVYHAENAVAALAELEIHGLMDLVLLDYRLDRGSDPNGLVRLKSRFPKLPVVIISEYEEVEPIVRSLREGALGFIPKSHSPKQLVRAIKQILSGHIYVPELNKPEQSREVDIGRAIEVAQRDHLKQMAELDPRVIRDKDLSQRLGSEFGATGSALNSLLAELEQDRCFLDTMAFSDELTGVASRRLFIERAECALKNAHRRNNLMALVYIDLNRFKVLNDSLGHAMGDKVLIEIARRLSKCVREVDTVSRLGGDEFTVVLVDIKTSDGVRDAAERIHRDLLKPVLLPGGGTWNIRLSMGVAVSSGDEVLLQLMNRAEELMYRVKNFRTNQYIID